MSRRCKSGQRARCIATGKNRGLIVLVVRPYLGEKIGDSSWRVTGPLPWVITSLGRPIFATWTGTGLPCPPMMTGVFDDEDLEPLDDDDDGLDESTDTDKPVEKPRAVLEGQDHG